jgi:hypothetical protein
LPFGKTGHDAEKTALKNIPVIPKEPCGNKGNYTYGLKNPEVL